MRPWIAANLILRPAYLALGEKIGRFRRILEKTQWLPRVELEQYQLCLLRDSLHRAIEDIPYYREIMSDHGVALEQLTDLREFSKIPILEREDIRNRGQRLRSQSKHLRVEVRKTSGSTGEPLYLIKDKNATAAMNAIMWRNYAWHGIGMGDRQARVWAGPVSRLEKWKLDAKDFLQNRIRLSSFVMDRQRLEHFVGEILAFRPQYFYGYAQFVYRLATYLLEAGVDLGQLHLKGVIVTGEMIYRHQRKVIEEAFRAKMVNEYGCTEAGILGMECPNGKMHLMSDNLFIEVLKDGVPAAPGVEGDIVITELYASLMPLIRYRIGDRGIVASEQCPCGRGLPLLERLSGRITDPIEMCNGTIIDPHVIDFFLKERMEFYDSVRQWKIDHEGGSRLLITLCTAEGRRDTTLESYLSKRFQTLCRDNVELKFKYSEWLEAGPSGKAQGQMAHE